MLMYDLIAKKRDGLEISPEEIAYFVSGYTKGDIPDYQTAAFLMAVYFKGLNSGETAALTRLMAESGEKIDLSGIPGLKVDKHSTGGVGDKTTLVLAPLVAAAGVSVAKLSGRGLGYTGGTVDKLESIPGFQTALDKDTFVRQVRDIGVAVSAQSAGIVPADRKIYALRNATATEGSIPLIASSIMSKKIAVGADAIVLDVKAGNGALLPLKEDTYELARLMVSIGRALGRTTTAVITDMNQPLGYAVGNSLEVREAIQALQGQGPPDLEELCLALGARMIVLAGRAAGVEEAVQKLSVMLKDGSALLKFKELIRAQGGDPEIIDHPEKLPAASVQEKVLSGGEGFVRGIETKDIGRAAVLLGAGRRTPGSKIDHGAGIVLHKKIGEPVSRGEALATLYLNEKHSVEEAHFLVHNSFQIGERPSHSPLLLDDSF
ncbi:MAG TPA: pyrimidine-nucleoside phosphorylase [Desulfotomaculum sp.]|nr:pyrimidine-nucleoside phosphorylase [Desulfotomaculum sp.]HBY03578.1 pyrimidine-nucleoside phosphorylase [Desulfotomaculum sp.]